MFHKQILSFLNEIDKQIKELDKELKTFPNGILRCARNKRKYNWYCCSEQGKQYIPRKNRDLATQLAYKTHLDFKKQDLLEEKQALEKCLLTYQKTSRLQHFNAHPEYQNLITSYQTPIDLELSQWKNTSYEKSQKHPESLIYKTESGNVFRSKSESIIALCLEKYQIPYRYECALSLNEATVYPDFTIFHPRTGKIIYWEHFGLMDQPDYVKNAYSKLSLYTTNGIIPSVHLIATFETQKDPLDISQIEALIKHYFL